MVTRTLTADTIVQALARRPEIAGWTLTRRRRHGTQLYVIGRDVENTREVTTEDFTITVFHDHPWPAGRETGTAGHARGVSSVKLVPGDTAHLESRLDEVIMMASLVHNPAYELPSPETLPNVALSDPLITALDGTRRAVWEMAEEVWEACDREASTGVRLSAGEFFVTVSDREFRTSKGIHASSETTHVAVEIALLARGASDDPTLEAETFRPVEARRVVDLRLASQVAEASRFARDTLRAQPTETRDGPVVVSGSALPPFFDPFVFHSGAQAAYMKLSRFTPDHSVFGDHAMTGDPLHVSSHALLPFGLSSHSFDGDGVPGRDTDMIVGGTLFARHATSRYAQYLGVPVTGEPGAVVVRAGTTPLVELLRDPGSPVVEIVAFSSPNVDDITGDVGCEIRLGYEHLPNGEVRPIKGGALAGNVFDAFASVRFSQETQEALISGFGGGGLYVGPRGARFEGMRVAGG